MITLEIIALGATAIWLRLAPVTMRFPSAAIAIVGVILAQVLPTVKAHQHPAIAGIVLNAIAQRYRGLAMVAGSSTIAIFWC